MIRRTSKLLLETLGSLVGGVAVVAAVGAWRLSSGPISLDFLSPYIEQALSAPDGSYSIKLDHTVLAWAGWSRTLNLRAEGVHAFDSRGRPLAAVPEIALGLSARGLVNGVIAPTSLDVIGAHVHLRRESSGQLNLLLGDPLAPEREDAVMPFLVQDLLQPPDPRRSMGYLRRVSVIQADLQIDDPRWDTSWKTRLDELVLARDAAGIDAHAVLDVAVGDAICHVDASATYAAATGAVRTEVAFAGVQPALFAHATPALAPLARVMLPLRGIIAIDSGVGRGLDALSFHVQGGEGRVSAPELYPEDVSVKSLEARGSLSDAGRRLDLAALFVDLGGATLNLNGTLAGLDGDSKIDLEIVGHDIKVDELQKRWPERVAPHPRAWVTTNLSGGAVTELHATVAAHGHGIDPASVAVDSIGGTMRLEGIDVHYLGEMPKVRAVAGDVRFDDKSFNIALNSGTVAGLSLDQATVAITGLDVHDQQIAIELVLHGLLSDSLRLVNYDPLHYASALGIDPEGISGETAVRVALRFPLVRDLHFAQVEVAAAANMKDVTVASAFFGRDLSQGDLTLRINRQGMEGAGKAMIGPMAVSLTWDESFGKSSERHVHLEGELDDAARKAFGLDWGNVVNGSLPAVLDLRTTPDRRSERIDFALDLAKAGLRVPHNAWRKAPGVPGRAHLTLLISGGRPTAIPRFTIEATDLAVRGHAAFDRMSGDFQSIAFDQLDFGFNSLAGEVAKQPSGGYDITVTGDSFDASSFIKEREPAAKSATETGAEKSGASASQGPPLSISFSVDKLWLAEEHRRPFRQASARVEYDGTHVTTGSIEADSVGGKKVAIALATAGTVTTLTIGSDDAGSVLKTLGITDNVVEGKLEGNAKIDNTRPDAPIPGLVRITDYKVMNAPLMAKILTLASLSGIVDQMNGEGISFSIFDVPFTKKEDVVELHDARAVGSELGITFNGTIDFVTGALDINGTIVPVYTLNSLLGNIPLLGPILVGPKGGGIFAATYTAKGDINDPDVSVNPLSALAPSILREFVDLLTRGGGPSVPPEQAQSPGNESKR